MIEIMEGYDRIDDIRKLFDEYTDSIIAEDSSIRKVLSVQGYEDESRHIEQKYGMPQGRLYIASDNGEPAGCAALRKFDDGRAEMKRLFVRPEHRGKGIGKLLAEKIIAEAAKEGYDFILLDSMDFMKSAQILYRSLGFTDIPPYYDSPLKERTAFLCLKL